MDSNQSSGTVTPGAGSNHNQYCGSQTSALYGWAQTANSQYGPQTAIQSQQSYAGTACGQVSVQQQDSTMTGVNGRNGSAIAANAAGSAVQYVNASAEAAQIVAVTDSAGGFLNTEQF